MRPCLAPAEEDATLVRPSAPVPRAERNLLGKSIGGKYFVRDILGVGGMGTVFDAVHLTVGRPVAIKVLRPIHARARDAVERFHREARAAARIGHPNVCAIHDLGTLEDGRPYLVMERLVGETLAHRIAESGWLPYDEVIDILIQTLSALAAAHDRHVIHRDIKPDNVFLAGRSGCLPLVKLLDFGISKTVGPKPPGAEETDLTRAGMVMGTPHYMSPEQARGDRNIDERVDVYACGVVLYEALTGQRPFTAASQSAVLRSVLQDEPLPLHELRRALPSAFEPVVRKAMHRDRAKRFANAVEFLNALAAARGHRSIIRASMHGRSPPRPSTPSPRPSPEATPTTVWVRGPAPSSVGDGEPTIHLVRR
jgi:serine/threonine-protein kinase